MTEPDKAEIIELLANTDTETAEGVAAIQRLGLRSLPGGSTDRDRRHRPPGRTDRQ